MTKAEMMVRASPSLRTVHYEMSEVLEEETVVHHEGQAIVLGTSATLMVMLTANPLQPQQILSVQVPQSEHADEKVYILEVCSARAVREGATALYLVQARVLGSL